MCVLDVVCWTQRWFFFYIYILKDICSRPTFIASGASRFDVEQGELGDPWYGIFHANTWWFQVLLYIIFFWFNNRLLAAISSLTLTPRFLDRVVPPDQTFDLHYCGLFRFVLLRSLSLCLSAAWFLRLNRKRKVSGFTITSLYMHNEMLVGLYNHRFSPLLYSKWVKQVGHIIPLIVYQLPNGNVLTLDWLHGSDVGHDEWPAIFLPFFYYYYHLFLSLIWLHYLITWKRCQSLSSQR